jgi:hypothetical protein
MCFDSVESLRRVGFAGFRTVRELRETGLRDVPAEHAGIYVVLRVSRLPPAFLERSRAGRYKGRDVAVPIAKLKQRWISGTPVVYVGKAGGSSIKAKLRSRLSRYIRTGYAKKASRLGGIRIWQLADTEDLLVAWVPTPLREPKAVEDGLLDAFRTRFGMLPFANIR